MDTPCPICDRGALARFLRIDAVPVMTTQLWPDADTADSAPRGDLDLAVCRNCGAIRNLAFDPSLVEYAGDYENSQLFSPAFRDYARELATDLVREFELGDGTVLEVGCGKGEFLEVLCGAGCARAIGYDSSYEGEIDDGPYAERIRIERRLLDERDTTPADLVVSRHVLEHIDEPLGALRSWRRATAETEAAFYVEVPDARYVISPTGMWDLIYQHVTYFSPPNLELLVRRAGLRPTRCQSVFGDQFLALRAEPSSVGESDSLDAEEVRGIVAAAHGLGERFADTLLHWEELLGTRARTALWGAGAKGVTFLNAMARVGGVDDVVDLNPRKQGSYLPGTGHEILAPDQLRDRNPGRVIVMNPMYRDEVAQALRSMDVDAEVLVA